MRETIGEYRIDRHDRYFTLSYEVGNVIETILVNPKAISMIRINKHIVKENHSCSYDVILDENFRFNTFNFIHESDACSFRNLISRYW